MYVRTGVRECINANALAFNLRCTRLSERARACAFTYMRLRIQCVAPFAYMHTHQRKSGGYIPMHRTRTHSHADDDDDEKY